MTMKCEGGRMKIKTALFVCWYSAYEVMNKVFLKIFIVMIKTDIVG